MEEVWIALEASSFAAAIREAVFIYPIANVLHVVAVIGFFGVVAAMDLHLLRVISGMPVRSVIGRLRPVAIALLLVIVTAGFVLFAADAVALAANPAFRIKLVAIGLALLNVGLNELALRHSGEDALALRITAGLSLVLWLSVAALGRSIAYV